MRAFRLPKASMALLLSGAVVASLAACGSDSEDPSRLERLRAAVLSGAREDFAAGTGAGGPAFEACVLGRLEEALDRPALERLVGVRRRPGGQQFAAQALNALAAPLAARCGHRFYVPKLVEASRGLRGRVPSEAAAKRLGVVYGPYLGIRCRRANRIGCDRVGIDVVFSARAKRVTAVVGGRRLRLRTPGLHSGVRGRDWVGTLERAGLSRRGSPLRVEAYGPGDTAWAGNPARYVRVELQVDFADRSRARAVFPAVFLSPGWG
jgi:hypothetical protein